VRKLKIYLAGPEVFLPNAKEVGKKKKDLCAKYGFEGLFPLDNEVRIKGLYKQEIAKKIYKANIAQINNSDIVVANISPFRGISADVGTVFEMGYASGIGRKVYSYTNTYLNFKERTLTNQRLLRDISFDKNGLLIEDFYLMENLMVAFGSISTTIGNVEGLEDLLTFECCLNEVMCDLYEEKE